MSVARPFLAAGALFASGALSLPASGAPLPDGRPSRDIRTSSGPQGGRIIVGREGAVLNAIAGLRTAIALSGTYFDGPPSVKSVVESADRRAAFATFTAVVRGTPVAGLTIVVRKNDGSAQIVALFDRPNHLGTSLRPMLASLGVSKPDARPVKTAVRAEKLRSYELPDGSASVELPLAWTVTSANQGQLMAHDPSNTENAVLGVSIPLTDPRAGMGARIAERSGGFVVAYNPDPAAAYVAFTNILGRRLNVDPKVTIEQQKGVPSITGRASFITGEETSPKGFRESFFGFVQVGPIGPMGGYTMTVTMMSGPSKSAASTGATLAAIFGSYRVNGAVRSGQVAAHEQETIARTQQTIAGIHATGDASMRNAAANQAAIDRSTSGYVHYLNGSDVVENVGSGSRASVDANFAQNLANADPKHFRVVPMAEYRARD